MDLIEILKDKYNIDIVVILLVFLAGYFQKSYFTGFRLSKNDHNDAMYKTLLLSGVVSGVYIYLNYVEDGAGDIPLRMYFMSYFTATSLYEMAVKPVTAWVNRNIKKVTK